MTTYAFASSKGGAGRTASSLLLALGLGCAGRRVLWVQVGGCEFLDLTMLGRPLPFHPAPIAMGDVGFLGQMIAEAAARGYDDAVVDLPASPVGSITELGGLDLLLVPLRPGRYEAGEAFETWSAAEHLYERQALRSRPWLLPVGWPGDDVAQAREGVVIRHRRQSRLLPEPEVSPWGVPELPREVLDGLYRADSRDHPRLAATATRLARVAHALAEELGARPVTVASLLGREVPRGATGEAAMLLQEVPPLKILRGRRPGRPPARDLTGARQDA